MMVADAVIMVMVNMKFSLFRFFDLIVGSGESLIISQSMFDIFSVVLFIIVLILCYIAFRDTFTIPRKYHHISIWWGIIFILIAYMSTDLLYTRTKDQGQLLLNPLFVSFNDSLDYLTHRSSFRKPTSWSGTQDLFQYTTQLGQWKRPNIILVFAESFSPEYSLHNGGLYNDMPHFDAIQRDGITLNNYMAPGCVSEHAHTSLLQGIIPIAYGDLFLQDGYTAFAADHDSLPLFFNKAWYQTDFLSTASLAFLNQRDFIKKVGYQTIVGEEAFSWKQQRAFGAASDEELYKKAIAMLSTQTTPGQKPLFLTMQTISSHQPWHSPYGDTVEDTFRYTDDQLGKFYEQLKTQKFFDNGLLVIVADHRIRWKPQDAVVQKLWPTRPSHVVATIVGTGIKPNTVDNNLYQAIDIHFWLKQLISTGTVPMFNFINNPFSPTPTIARNRGIYYCKYIDNTIHIIENKTFLTLDQASPTIQRFIGDYQSYQFNHIILHETGSMISSSWSSIISHWKQKPFLLIGHWWAPKYAPFDSLSWFLTAIHQWADGVELDLSYTADGINIVRHGPHGHEPSDKVENSCYGRTFIPLTEYETLRKQCTLPDGEKILTFDELLHLTKDIIPLYIVEIKVYDPLRWPEQFRKALLTAKKYGVLDKVIRTSYDPTVRRIIAKQKDGIPARDMYNIKDEPSESFRSTEYIMMPFEQLSNKKILNQLKTMGKPIITYTPTTAQDIIRSYTIGISWLLVDDIPLARKTIERYISQQKTHPNN